MQVNTQLVFLVAYLASFAPLGLSLIRSLPIQQGLLIDVGIGTPPKEFKMLLDTATMRNWVKSTANVMGSHVLDHEKFYNNSESSTYIADGEKWSAYYDSTIGVAGYLSIDDVVISGLKAERQTFAEINASYTLMSNFIKFHGSIGLGSTYIPSDQLDLVQSLYQQNQLDQAMFSIHLTRDPRSKKIGELILGGIDERLYEGEIIYTPVLGRRWQFQFDYITTSNADKRYSKSTTAILDSTTNIIIAPGDKIDYYLNVYNTSSGYYMGLKQLSSCNPEDQPDLILNIAGTNLTIKPEQLIMKFNQEGRELCYLGIRPRKGLHHVVLGTQFMRLFYTVYDYSNNRIGFAPSKPNGSENPDDDLHSRVDESKHERTLMDDIKQKRNSQLQSEDDDDDNDEMDESGELCSICLSGFKREKPWDIECGHKFHKTCLIEFYEKTHKRPECFLCRKPLIHTEGKDFDYELSMLEYSNLAEEISKIGMVSYTGGI